MGRGMHVEGSACGGVRMGGSAPQLLVVGPSCSQKPPVPWQLEPRQRLLWPHSTRIRARHGTGLMVRVWASQAPQENQT